MASHIESLASELLDMIAVYLDLVEISRLLQCSRNLHRRLEPVLYADGNALNDAMLWACKNGSLRTIRLAVSYGARVSQVIVRKRVPKSDSLKSFQPLTLHLAAKKGHADAFALLLELGAGITGSESDSSQFKACPLCVNFNTVGYADSKSLQALVRHLRVGSVGTEVLLRHFLAAGLGPQIREFARLDPTLDIPAAAIIHNGGSLDLVKIILDDGAPLKQLARIGKRTFISPLSAAILVNSTPLVDLMIARGADIHCTDGAFFTSRKAAYNFSETEDFPYPFWKPLHIPIFAAAQAMAKYGVAMMQRCLDEGADINRPSHRTGVTRQPFNRQYNYTPLLFYLESITSWSPKAKLRPIVGLEYLMSRGATLEMAGEKPSNYLPYVCLERPSPIEILLDKWGLEQLADPEFFATIKFLLESGAAKRHAKIIMDKYLRRQVWSQRSKKMPDILPEWRAFIDLLCKNQPTTNSIDSLLREVILQQGGDLNLFGDFGRATIDSLLKAGANINHKPGRHILHKLCESSSSGTFHYLSEFVHVSAKHKREFNIYKCWHVQQRIQFFKYLLEKGADPLMSYGGRTAINILMEKADMFSDDGKRIVSYQVTLAAYLGDPHERGFEASDGKDGLAKSELKRILHFLGAFQCGIDHPLPAYQQLLFVPSHISLRQRSVLGIPLAKSRLETDGNQYAFDLRNIMADDAAVAPTGGASTGLDSGDHDASQTMPHFLSQASRKSTLTKSAMDVNAASFGGTDTPMTFPHHHTPELSDYFVGPRDLESHSKLPYFMRMHGSVLPRMLLPLTLIGAWSTLITCLHNFVTPLVVSNVLLTVLGFVVGLALSFRSSTAYERYSDGRRAWSTVSVQCRNLGRMIWISTTEREGQTGKEDLLGKITAMNLVVAFAVSLKHKLRFEPFAHYPDVASLIGHLDTYAKAAYKEEHLHQPKKTPWKRAGEYLGLTMAYSNPRKELKRSDKPLGNLPLEVLTYLNAYIEEVVNNQTLKSAVVAGQMFTALSVLTDAQAANERVLATPLPIGYNILISQIVLLYVYLLPFQLVSSLNWITIPGTIAAAYIIIGLAAIGNELENPFGDDVNDLPLDHFCDEISKEIDVIMSVKAPVFSDFIRGPDGGSNQVLWPLSTGGCDEWSRRSESDIRSALRAKVVVGQSRAVESISEKSVSPSVVRERVRVLGA
ncbi:hypothetical protein G7Y89_g8537 [Cudoniella acicularis]|uniref:Uncharacterized protein n=1 Tax=Cudoniella acicularis TaxID=354080 RepID=A0A8H4RJ69_9HELO|nr:hypothetical protein G7Y89_g8537 [Cudoniella acicularis]